MTSVKSHSIEQRVISADAASTAVRAAVAKADELGLRINVAVCDSSGVLAAFLRMPGAFLHSVDIAIDKAYTSAGFGFPTSKWGAALTGDELLRAGLPLRPRLVIFSGGLPIKEGGVVIGGIGVSGASAAQDEICAQAGIDAIGL
ncbi:GlcG/HbpS family heme-binding protein [Ottowia testudinis]|uniref:Heme-binding protein n=1 Tax=Ottowia testudinis TaxID=2816950 RepID=A0A975CPB0_9BURK|nr:heme-binding protein [Ottowia testudinis]QTD47203.1 heme-binding protein [Ottowia testudinis]